MSLQLARRVLEIEARAITHLIERLDHRFEQAVRLVCDCQGRVVVTGMGKSGIICRKIAATLNSTGTPSMYLHPAEALHGDLGMVVAGDVVIAISNSGETEELVALIDPLKRLEIPLVAFVGRTATSLDDAADVTLDVSVDQEACPMGLAPTASTSASLALGDALAMAVLEAKGFSEDDFRVLHPRGQLGFKLLHVADVMHVGDELPVVKGTDAMREVIYEISRKGLGITGVVDEGGKLVGVISDGDVRRLVEKNDEVLGMNAAAGMTSSPATIARDEAASSALAMLERHKITALAVPDEDGRLIGIVHLHDLWRLGKYF